MHDMLKLVIVLLVMIQAGTLVGLLLRAKEYRKVLKGQVDQNKRLLYRVWQLLEDNSELRKEIRRVRGEPEGLAERGWD